MRSKKWLENELRSLVRVSIRLLMDNALEETGALVCLLQVMVSIRLLMDNALEVGAHWLCKNGDPSFNPTFNG